MTYIQILAMYLLALPATIIGYTLVTLKDFLIFCFNATVDIWIMISNAVHGIEEEDTEQEEA
jgi:hypothetical protein